MICCSRGPTEANFSSMHCTSRMRLGGSKMARRPPEARRNSCTRVFVSLSESIRAANSGQSWLPKCENLHTSNISPIKQGVL